MRRMLFGILGFAALGLGAAASQPAVAQGYGPGYRDAPAPAAHRGYGYGPVAHGPRHGYRPRVYPAPAYGWRGPRRGYYRPVYGPPRCFVRMERAWNGWSWIRQPVRICR